MNDRYLFRAKRTDNREWVEGFYCKRKTGHYDNIGFHEEYRDCIIAEFSDGGITWCDVDPSTICQCTGLKDKNGKLIWENDIVKDNVIFGSVSWDDINERFFIDDIQDGYQDYSDWWHEVQVIGNIFDNPELLEVGE